jgi:DUF971 family protein
MSVRCNCEFYGVKTSSEWASLDFITPWPNSVGNVKEQQVALEVYPNPVKNILTIRLSIAIPSANISITDINGRLIRTQKIENEITNIDVSALSTGLYLLKYFDDNHSSVSKFIKE